MSRPISTPIELQTIPAAITDLLTKQKLAVLATQIQGQPHTSLVAFAVGADGRELLFATSRSSRKFANLQADPRAALLIDSRTHQESDFHEARALSAMGRVIEVSANDLPSRLQIFLTKLPYLSDFVQSPSCALMSFQVQEYNLVSRFQKVIRYRLAS